MNKQDFIKILQKPVNISAAELKLLEELAVSFPFCQAAHILIAKGNFDYGSMLTEQKIKRAALYTTNRKNLKKFIQLREISPSELIPDYQFDEETTVPLTEDTATTKRQSQIIDSFLEKFQVKETQEPPVPAYNLLEEISDSEVQQPDAESLSKKKSRNSYLIDSFLSAANPKPKKAENISALHKDLKDNLEKLRALRNSLKKESDKPEETETDLRIRRPLEEKVSQPEQYQQPEQEPNEDKNSDTGKSPAVFQPLAAFNNYKPGNPSEEDYEAPGESELLIGYLDFLKSERSVFKRDQKKINQIIDKFIKEDPAISPLKAGKTEENLPDLSSGKIAASKTPVSETFAMLLEKQGKISKAIEIYKELILKFPEKNSYFATRITELKNKL